MKSTHICPNCGNKKKFTTVAHVAQEWVVDANGNFISVAEDCTDVIAEPNDDNIWTCCECGAEAIVTNE